VYGCNREMLKGEKGHTHGIRNQKTSLGTERFHDDARASTKKDLPIRRIVNGLARIFPNPKRQQNDEESVGNIANASPRNGGRNREEYLKKSNSPCMAVEIDR